MSSCSIVVATTEGPSQLLRLAHEGDGLQSVVCLNRTTELTPIASAYDAFVRQPTGIIESRFGLSGFRIDLSHSISAGHSWQLGFYLAHVLFDQGRLCSDHELNHDVLWVTGEVNHDQEVLPISHMDLKLERSELLIRQVQQSGGRIRFLLPADNLHQIEDVWMQKNGVSKDDLIAVATLSELEHHFATGSSSLTIAEKSRSSIYWRIFQLLFLLFGTLWILGGYGSRSSHLPSHGMFDEIAKTPVQEVIQPEAQKSEVPKPEPFNPEVAAPVISPMITADQLTFLWRPIYLSYQDCNVEGGEALDWKTASPQLTPQIESKKLCGIEVMPQAEVEDQRGEQLSWYVSLYVESGNHAHPVTRLDGRSYSAEGKSLRWFVLLPDTLLSDVLLRWDVELTDEQQRVAQQSFNLLLDYAYQW